MWELGRPMEDTDLPCPRRRDLGRQGPYFSWNTHVAPLGSVSFG